MLVLTRNPGESIDIDQEISVTVLSVRHNQVKLGINAPPHVKIYRREITLEILANSPNEQEPWQKRVKDHIKKMLGLKT